MTVNVSSVRQVDVTLKPASAQQTLSVQGQSFDGKMLLVFYGRSFPDFVSRALLRRHQFSDSRLKDLVLTLVGLRHRLIILI